VLLGRPQQLLLLEIQAPIFMVKADRARYYRIKTRGPPAMFTHTGFVAGTHTTSDLADLANDAVRSCDIQLINYGGHHRFAGTVRTLLSRRQRTAQGHLVHPR